MADVMAERGAPRASPCRVLLVDDDALTSMSTSDVLSDLGHQVVEARSARRALEILREGTPIDVVVTDQAMPGMTGTQLAAEIRASWPDLPIIVATGYAELPAERAPRLLHLMKPYLGPDLDAAIVTAVQQR